VDYTDNTHEPTFPCEPNDLNNKNDERIAKGYAFLTNYVGLPNVLTVLSRPSPWRRRINGSTPKVIFGATKKRGAARGQGG